VRLTDPAAVLHCIDTGRAPAGIAAALGYLDSDLARMLNRWRHRIGEIPDATDLARYERDGIRLLCPGDREWPSALYDLDDTCPYALWLRGDLDLGACSEKSAAIAGSRAATGYGAHVAGQLATDLAGQGWAIVSGAAYGIDAAAHRGALTVMDRGPTIAVLASGVNRYYPAGHHDLLTTIAGCGLVISESPPGHAPTRGRFTARNRIIAALSGGTVIVEAGLRSGAMNTAGHAFSLGRPLMAVPGPVTSAQSSGCHELIRTRRATLVTGSADVLDVLSPAAAWTPDYRARDEVIR
jgi:DNA processing protein